MANGRWWGSRAASGPHGLKPAEVAQIEAQVKTALARTTPDRFPVERYQGELSVALQRRGEVCRARRARVLPYRATGATALTAAGGWGSTAIVDLLAGPAGHLIAAAATPAAAAVALAAARLVAARRIGEWSGTYRTAAVTAVGWLAAAAVLGPGWWAWLGMALIPAATWVAQPWLRAHRQLPASGNRLAVAHRPPAELALGEPVPVVAPLDDLADFAARWHEEVACRDGKAAGSQLAAGARFPNGLEFLLTMAGGMTLPQLQSRLVEIASLLDCDPLQLVLDDPPASTDGWRSAKRAELRYVIRSPITKVVEWTGPRYSDGRCGIGPYADGQGVAEFVLFAENSMRNGVAIGSTGSGKSGLINGLVASGRSSGMVATIYLDPKVNSSPELAQTATVPVLGLERAEEFTRAVEMLVHGRRLESGLNDWPGFTPSRRRPGYWVVIDECDMLFCLPGMATRWGMIAKTGRALGVGLLLATQVDNVMAFGNNEMLRSNVAAGNVILLRTESASSGGKLIAPDLPSSRSLPKVPGYAYLNALDSRRAPLRAAYLRSVQNCPDGYNALTALQQHPDAPLDAIGTKAFEAFLGGTREERRERDKARLRADLEAFLGGTLQELPAPRQSSGVDHLLSQVPKALTASNVVPLRPAVGPELDRKHATAVLVAMDRGCERNKDMIDATGLDGVAVSKTLTWLADAGLVEKVAHGTWTVTARGRAVLAA